MKRYKKDELSLSPDNSTRLSKTLRPHPDKYHGMTNVENRYRQRYLDLLNPNTAQTFKKRTKMVNSIRELLTNMDFMEVETPVLQSMYGGANAKPFITKHNSLKQDMFMRISNELYLKRLIIGGLDRVYEFSKDFRNEDIDSTHNPEFTQLKLYGAYLDYKDMMDITETLFKNVCEKVNGTNNLEYQGIGIDFEEPWKRMTMEDAVKKYSGINWKNTSDEELKHILDKNKIEQKGGYTKGKALNWLFEEFVENNLIQPTIIMDYPSEISPLAKQHRDKEGLVERFEFFINGKEYGNAYSELNDPIEQRKRFLEQIEQKTLGDDEAHLLDEEFLTAMEYGMPPTGGLGIGIDRLAMLMTNKASIKDVLLFPTLKTQI
ncbi:MAG: lysine--tRNA ligase [Candidatus Aenigmatarchaeota archaeon]|nr:MAG: lysine--tRNA ligase [Candidatus Aenigmarchaeota archaeon]